MSKRIISIFLIASFVMSLSTTAFASDIQEEIFEDYGEATVAEGIIVLEDGSYGMVVNSEKRNSDEIIPVGRMDINPCNEDQVEGVMASEIIPKEVKEEIARIVSKATENKSSDMTISYFSTELLKERGSSSTYYTTSKGVRVRRDLLTVNNDDTGMVKVSSGAKAHTVASQLTDLAITSAGLVKKTSLLASGISLLRSFMNTYSDSVVSGSGGDYVEVCLTFDSERSFYYAYIADEWQIGVVSGLVHVDKIETRQHYYDSETDAWKNHTTERTTASDYAILGSLHDYKKNSKVNPWEKAAQWAGNPITENFSFELGSKRFSFF